MVDNVKTSPKFDGLNFFIWKVKMTVFLQSLGSSVAKAITNPFVILNGDENTWSDITVKELEANAKAHYDLLQALNNEKISKGDKLQICVWDLEQSCSYPWGNLSSKESKNWFIAFSIWEL